VINFLLSPIPTECFFARPDAIQGTLVQSLKWGRPTAMFAVPRVWEKLEIALRQALTDEKEYPPHLVKQAMKEGTALVMAKNNKTPLPTMSAEGKAMIEKIKASVGLDQSESFYFGAAPLKKSSTDFFFSLDMPLYNLYGMSENSGAFVIHNDNKFHLDSSGFPMPGLELAIGEPDKNNEGEVWMRGRNVMMGYLNNEKATIGTFTPDGFLKSGDKGRIDKDGFLKITGRFKEIIITAGGENIAPVPTEDMFKLHCPPCSNIMMLGEQQRFMAALITFKVDIDPKTGVPTKNLMQEARVFFKKELGLDLKTTDDAVASPKVVAYVQKCLNETNKKVVSRAATIRKFTLLPVDFSIPGDELTPTLKLKRSVTTKKYQKEVDAMFAAQPKL